MDPEAPPSTMTPAEKAEHRRQRILAKKTARMAYASGLRAEAPSTAPDEPVIPPPPQREMPSAADFEIAQTIDVFRPATAQQRRHQQAIAHPALAWLSLAVLRPCAMVLAPMLYALWITSSDPSTVRVSAVELFLQLELFANLSHVVPFAAQLVGMSGGESGQGDVARGGTQGGIFAKIALAGRALAGAKVLYKDAVLFGFSFLVTMRVAELAWSTPHWMS
jgi:hypothetical protein